MGTFVESKHRRGSRGEFVPTQTDTTLARDRATGYAASFAEREIAVDTARRGAVLAASGYQTAVIGNREERDAYAARVAEMVSSKSVSYDQHREMLDTYKAANVLPPVEGERPLVTIDPDVPTGRLTGGPDTDEGTRAPGELALAHTGTVYVPDQVETGAASMDVIRAATEHKRVRHSHGDQTYEHPADYTLVLGQPSCGCDRTRCVCNQTQKDQYGRRAALRMSGPLASRAVQVRGVDPEEMSMEHESDMLAVNVQTAEQKRGLGPTSRIGQDEALALDQTPEATELLASRTFGDSHRAQMLRVARTIHDMEGYGNQPVSVGSVTAALGTVNMPDR